jgi:hypothetical protein
MGDLENLDIVASGSGPTRAPHIGFVHLDGDIAPVQGKKYPVVPASALPLGELPYPTTPRSYLDLDVQQFYSGDLPDVWGKNEGLLRIQIDTRAPQDLSREVTASFLTKFKVDDHAYAGGFESRGVFRNVLFDQYVNVRFALYELDTDVGVYVDKVMQVVKDSGLGKVDVLKGIPYLDVGTKLIESIAKNFGKNPDDEIWTEIPVFQFRPVPGSVFLRSGIYVVADRPDADRTFPDDLWYRDGHLTVGSSTYDVTHMIFAIGVRSA